MLSLGKTPLLAPGWRVSKMRFHGAIFTSKYHHKISPRSILNCLSKNTFGQSHKTSSTKAYYLYITNYIKCQRLSSKTQPRPPVSYGISIDSINNIVYNVITNQ